MVSPVRIRQQLDSLLVGHKTETNLVTLEHLVGDLARGKSATSGNQVDGRSQDGVSLFPAAD